jgi:endonuclease/exonuclease/phosphatase family metal-dependent hydrolase
MLDDMNGQDALHGAQCEIEDLIYEYGSDKLICAGDFNLWPDHVTRSFEEIGMTSVTDLRASFPKLTNPVAGSRIWTHKNGAKASDGARQELDFIFLSKDLVKRVDGTKGGVGDFPDSWDMSDHAPVTVDLKLK